MKTKLVVYGVITLFFVVMTLIAISHPKWM